MDEPPMEDLNLVGHYVFNFLHSYATLGVEDE